MLDRTSKLPKNADDPEPERFDPWRVLNFIWRHWLLIAAGVAVMAAVSTVYLANQTPLYTAAAQVLLEPENAASTGATTPSTSPDNSAVDNQLAILRSSSFIQRVVERGQLTDDPEFGAPSTPQAGQSPIAQILSYISGHTPNIKEAPPRTERRVTPTPSQVTASVQALMGATSVYRVGLTNLLTIAVTSKDPRRAAHLANLIADVYLSDKLDTRLDAVKRASAWLNDRLVEMGRRLHDSEAAVTKFRQEHELVKTSTTSTLNQQRLPDLSKQLDDATAELDKKKSLLDQVTAVDTTGNDIQNLPAVFSTTVMQKYQETLLTLEQQDADNRAKFTDKYPFSQTQRQRDELKARMLVEIQRVTNEVRRQYTEAENNFARTQRARREAIQEISNQANAGGATEITLRELERNAAVDKTLYEDFLQRSKIMELSSFEVRDARVITPALPPATPSYPRKGQVTVTALAMGLFLGIVGGLVREMQCLGFATPQEVEDALGLPVLASISRQRRDRAVNGRAAPFSFRPITKPLSRFSEAIRSLRSGIQASDLDDPPKVIQVTSTLPGEGKTTVALSLAASAAESGLRVVVVDADLRQRGLSRRFGFLKAPGLVDLLVNNGATQDTIKFIEDGKFWMLASGIESQNPPDLLASERMRSLVLQLKNDFDFVVIDAPPLTPVIDSVVISRVVDKVILVVQWTSTPREMVKQAIGTIPGCDSLAGIVLNSVDEKRARKYGNQGLVYKYRSAYEKYYVE